MVVVVMKLANPLGMELDLAQDLVLLLDPILQLHRPFRLFRPRTKLFSILVIRKMKICSTS